MLNSEKAKITKIINNITDLFRILLCLFLIAIIVIWLIQMFNIEQLIPFYGSISAFLTKFNSYFVTQDIRDENNCSIMYLAINVLVMLLAFSVVNGIVKDMMKMYERSREEAIEEDNIRINEQIKKNYEYHLKHSMQFVILARFQAQEDTFQSLAFYDADYTLKHQKEKDRMLEDVRRLINSSVDTPKDDLDGDILFYISSAEQLNRVLVFIRSVCKIKNYVKLGLEYMIAVSSYTNEEQPAAAIREAKKFLALECKNKIICQQIVSECLNALNNSNFIAMANGNYENIPDSLYELVEKSSY